MADAPVIAAIELEHAGETLALSGVLAELLDAPLVVAAVSPGGAAAVRELAADLLHGRPFEVRVVRDKRAARKFAAQASAAAIVVAASPRGRFGRGGADEGLVEHAECPVAIASRGYSPRSPRTIGCAFNATPESRVALALGARLARQAGAKLEVLTCAEPPFVTPLAGLTYFELMARKVGHAKRRAREALAELAPDAEADVVVLEGDAADVIAERSRGLDLLVCGARTCGQVRALVVGSTSRRLAGSARCSLIVTPRAVDRQPLGVAEVSS